MREAEIVQPLRSQYRDYVSPSFAHVAEAAEVLAIGEFDLFRLAYLWWYDVPCDEALLDDTFGDYLINEDVPPWVRHYCRRVLILAAVDQLDPRDFGVERPVLQRLSMSEQRFASLVTLLAFFVYWIVFT